MDPMQNWLNQDQLFPLMPTWELVGGLAALAVGLSSLKSTSPLSLLIGGRPGIYS